MFRPQPRSAITGMLALAALLPAGLAIAQADRLSVDHVAVGPGTGTVRVGVNLRDVLGTPLGGDQTASHRITGLGINLTGFGHPCVTGVAVRSGAADGLLGRYRATTGCVASVEASPDVTGTNQGYLYAAPQPTGCPAIPLNTGAGLPGERLFVLELTLSACPAGLVIPVQLTRSGPVASTISSDSGITEKDGQGLEVADGAVTIGLAPAGLAVDLAGNGVLEPGETAMLAPSWSNALTGPVALTGAAGDLSGPAGGTYNLPDTTATYGNVAAGATTSCLATGDCYTVSVAATTPRPATHWDVTLVETLTPGGAATTWTVHVGASFTDVATSHGMYRYVETLLHSGVTAGCTWSTYCPTASLTRAQMAMLLARAMSGGVDAAVPASGSIPGLGSYACGAPGGSRFTDVATTASYCRHVHLIASRGVTLGCVAGSFCPGGIVSRGQMAMFLARAMTGSDAGVPLGYVDPTSGRAYSCDPALPVVHFTDVGPPAQPCRHAHYLWARAVADGCTATTFCPASPVSRAASAKLIVNGFGFSLYGP
jgi:hypothetical protein